MTMTMLQKGFTLVELMIVVTIIGILAAIAIPAYQDYITRSQATESLVLLKAGKTPLAEFFGDKGRWPLAAESVMGNTGPGRYVATIVKDSGTGTGTMTLTATMKTVDVSPVIAGTTIVLRAIPDTTAGALTWQCIKGTIDEKYLPASCR